jgi:hypothetical protein
MRIAGSRRHESSLHVRVAEKGKARFQMWQARSDVAGCSQIRVFVKAGGTAFRSTGRMSVSMSRTQSVDFA